MTTQYPAAKDNFTRPQPGQNHASPSLTSVIDNAYDAIEAIEDDVLPSGGISRKPATNDAILYVSPNGDDSNDGKSWGSAKETILAAYDALPAQGNTQTGGTIYFASGSTVGGEVSGQGLWIVGPLDGAYASPPPGWRKQKHVSFIGVGLWSHGGGTPTAQFTAGSTTDVNKPAIWLTGINSSIHFENLLIRYPAVAIRIGIATDLSTREVNTSGIRFRQVTAMLNNVAGNGPTVDLGYCFWIWFEGCVLYGNTTEAFSSDKRAVMLMKPNTPGAGASVGILTLRDCIFHQGGIRYYQGSSSWGPLHIENITQEGNFVDAEPPAVHLFNMQHTGAGVINGITVADAANPIAVQVEGSSRPANLIVMNAQPVVGPATIVAGGEDGTAFGGTIDDTLAGAGQVGFWRGRVAAQHDSSRRAFAPTVARFVNHAAQDASTWGSLSGTATVTTGQSAPDGSTGAALLSSASGELYRRVASATPTLAVGDHLFAGVWMRGSDPTQGPNRIIFRITGTTPNSVLGVGSTSNTNAINGPIKGDGEWEWVATVAKIVSLGTGTPTIELDLTADPTNPTVYFAPLFCVLPTATISDNEAAELRQHLQSWPDGAPVSAVSTLRGQKLIGRGGLGVGNSATGNTLGQVTRKVEIFDASGASLGYLPVYDNITTT